MVELLIGTAIVIWFVAGLYICTREEKHNVEEKKILESDPIDNIEYKKFLKSDIGKFIQEIVVERDYYE